MNDFITVALRAALPIPADQTKDGRAIPMALVGAPVVVRRRYGDLLVHDGHATHWVAPESSDDGAGGLSRMTKAGLVAYAARRGLGLDEGALKNDLIEASEEFEDDGHDDEGHGE